MVESQEGEAKGNIEIFEFFLADAMKKEYIEHYSNSLGKQMHMCIYGHAGMPLLGDQRYGSEESREVSMQLGIRTIRLQAVKLAFCHPTSGKRVCYELTDKLTL